MASNTHTFCGNTYVLLWSYAHIPSPSFHPSSFLLSQVRQRLRKAMTKASASPALLAAAPATGGAAAGAAAAAGGRKGVAPLKSLQSMRLQAVFSLEKPRAKLLDLQASTGQAVGPTVTSAPPADADGGIGVGGGRGGSADGSTATHGGVASATRAAVSDESDMNGGGATATALSAADFQVRYSVT